MDTGFNLFDVDIALLENSFLIYFEEYVLKNAKRHNFIDLGYYMNWGCNEAELGEPNGEKDEGIKGVF